MNFLINKISPLLKYLHKIRLSFDLIILSRLAKNSLPPHHYILKKINRLALQIKSNLISSNLHRLECEFESLKYSVNSLIK